MATYLWSKRLFYNFDLHDHHLAAWLPSILSHTTSPNRREDPIVASLPTNVLDPIEIVLLIILYTLDLYKFASR